MLTDVKKPGPSTLPAQMRHRRRRGLPTNFCFRPWTEIFYHVDKIGPCCNNRLVQTTNSEKYLHSTELNELKKDFLQNKKNPSCFQCWDAEESGIQSVRQQDDSFGKAIQRVGLRFSNKCNFKCRMCGPTNSSSWVNDKEAIKLRTSLSLNPKLKKISYMDKEIIDWVVNLAQQDFLTVTLIGGEPILTDEYIYFLEQCEEKNIHSNISLILDSNISTIDYRSINSIEHWQKFHRVEVYPSIDGLDTVGEYIRHGFIQTKFDKNFNLIKSFVKFLSVTLQLYNIYEMPKLFKYAENNNVKINFSFLVEPSYLSIHLFDREQKDLILQDYRNKGFYHSDINKALENDMYSPEQLSSFIKYTDGLDRLWKTDFKTSIPELATWYKRIRRENSKGLMKERLKNND